MAIAVVPTRRGSERVPNKNTRPFAGIEGGLTRIKVAQLAACPEVTSVILTTDDIFTISNAHAWASPRPEVLRIDKRPDEFASSATRTDDLIDYVATLLGSYDPDEVVLWTHVTSPFFQSSHYSRALAQFDIISKDQRYDSLMTARQIRDYLWNSTGPVNYHSDSTKWPATQSLTPLWLIDNSAFIARTRTYLAEHNRIGRSPYFLSSEWPDSLDIDWMEDFHIAEDLWMQGLGKEFRPSTLVSVP
jgi:CMP-N-acetylneuraminic acid synthetase